MQSEFLKRELNEQEGVRNTHIHVINVKIKEIILKKSKTTSLQVIIPYTHVSSVITKQVRLKNCSCMQNYHTKKLHIYVMSAITIWILKMNYKDIKTMLWMHKGLDSTVDECLTKNHWQKSCGDTQMLRPKELRMCPVWSNWEGFVPLLTFHRLYFQKI